MVDRDTKFIVSDKEEHTISILFDETASDDYIEALDGMTHITEFYIITKKNKVFKTIKDQINDILGNIIVDVPVKMPMSDGFKANAAFFKLGFLDKTKVSLGKQFKEMLPTLWMKAGAYGPCPVIEEGIPDMLLLPKNRMAILNDENCFSAFAQKIAEHPEIDVVYIVTDYEASFASMTASLQGKTTYQLYRDYLDNFRINARRSSR